MKKLLFFLLFGVLVFAQTPKQEAAAIGEPIKVQPKDELLKNEELAKKIESYLNELKSLEESANKKNSVWIKGYSSYLTSAEVRENLAQINQKIDRLERKWGKSSSEHEELTQLISREKIVSAQLEKLKKRDSAPFSNLIVPSNIDALPTVTSPIDIFNALAFQRTINLNLEEYLGRKSELNDLVSLLKAQMRIYKELESLDANNSYEKSKSRVSQQLDLFRSAYATMSVTSDVYQKRVEMASANIDKLIASQMVKMVKIFITILVIFFIFVALKRFAKKYITDDERFYMTNKIITFVNFTLIILVLLFSYIDNVGYFITILGFASAGIAIAMKDWFMSMLGWLVIVFGGSIHVGDRIRVTMDGVTYLGDVMDISLLRITLMEDVTLTTLYENRRAGRIVFIPNNLVFTKMFSNYTHASLKTVWDGIDITITFDSNHQKAAHIAREATKKLSKGYADITRKQLSRLRSNYSLKNTSVEPKIFTLIEPNGIKISAWYLTNAYATLGLRSTISMEIIDAYMREPDITIAYPTQTIHVEKRGEVV